MESGAEARTASTEDVIDLEECFLDSPPYRDRLGRCDQHLQDVEHCLRSVLKTARGVITATHGTHQTCDIPPNGALRVQSCPLNTRSFARA